LIEACGRWWAAAIIDKALVNVFTGWKDPVVINAFIEVGVSASSVVGDTFVYVRATLRHPVVIYADYISGVSASSVFSLALVYVSTLRDATVIGAPGVGGVSALAVIGFTGVGNNGFFEQLLNFSPRDSGPWILDDHSHAKRTWGVAVVVQRGVPPNFDINAVPPGIGGAATHLFGGAGDGGGAGIVGSIRRAVNSYV